MYAPDTEVRLLRTDGTISQDVFVVEEDKNAGDVRLVRKDTIVRDDKSGKIISGTRIIANAQRVFPEDIIHKAPVIDLNTESVAHCPTCHERHTVNPEDFSITCSKHGVFELYRTKEQVRRAKRPATEKSTKSKDKEVKHTTTATEAAPAQATAQVNLDEIKAMGELWVKRLKFDYSHIDARGYALLIEIDGTLYKHCFNTYNGTMGKKASDNDLSKLRSTNGAYKVADAQKARDQLAAKGYTKVD